MKHKEDTMNRYWIPRKVMEDAPRGQDGYREVGVEGVTLLIDQPTLALLFVRMPRHESGYEVYLVTNEEDLAVALDTSAELVLHQLHGYVHDDPVWRRGHDPTLALGLTTVSLNRGRVLVEDHAGYVYWTDQPVKVYERILGTGELLYDRAIARGYVTIARIDVVTNDARARAAWEGSDDVVYAHGRRWVRDGFKRRVAGNLAVEVVPRGWRLTTPDGAEVVVEHWRSLCEKVEDFHEHTQA